MTTENTSQENVQEQPGGEVVEGTDSQEVKEEPKPLTSEEIQQMISQEAEKIRRNLQSEKDKAVSEVRREAERTTRGLQAEINAYKNSFGSLDEDTRTQAELEYYRNREREAQTLTSQEQLAQQQAQWADRLDQSLRDEVKAMGLDPDDNRIDYAKDASDYFTGRQRFTESLATIVKGNQQSIVDNAVKQAEERFKALEADFRKEHGLDTQDESGGGDIDVSYEAFRKRMADKDYVATPADIERAKKELEK